MAQSEYPLTPKEEFMKPYVELAKPRYFDKNGKEITKEQFIKNGKRARRRNQRNQRNPGGLDNLYNIKGDTLK